MPAKLTNKEIETIELLTSGLKKSLAATPSSGSVDATTHIDDRDTGTLTKIRVSTTDGTNFNSIITVGVQPPEGYFSSQPTEPTT